MISLGELTGFDKPEPEGFKCRKRAYKTPALADQHLQSLLALPDCINPETLYVYRCRSCQLWHVGHELRETIHVPPLSFPSPQRKD